MSESERLTTFAASERLGIDRTTLSGLAKSRGWQGERVGTIMTYSVDDIEAEIARRALAPMSTPSGKIAERIRRYWKARGYTVKVWIDCGNVRSDMVNGFPRR